MQADSSQSHENGDPWSERDSTTESANIPKIMPNLSYRTAGESHGKAMLALIEGLPAGVPIDLSFIDGELRRRQGPGDARGKRQRGGVGEDQG